MLIHENDHTFLLFFLTLQQNDSHALFEYDCQRRITYH